MLLSKSYPLEFTQTVAYLKTNLTMFNYLLCYTLEICVQKI